MAWSCPRIQAHAALSTSTRRWFLGSSPGRPSGCASDLSGLGPGRPSAKVLGISLALDFVEQSRAAAVKAADLRGASSACCLNGLDRSCPGSRDQSMGSTLQPQKRKAFARGMLGPHMRSTINGPSSWDPVWGCESSDPMGESPSPPGHPQDFFAARHSLAPWFCIPQTRSPLRIAAHLCWPLGHDGPALHCPCWKAWHSADPSLMARATARPAIGFASGGLPPRAAGLAGDACWRSLVGAEKLPAGTQWASLASYVALMTWPSVRVDSLKRLTQSALSSVSLCRSHASLLAWGRLAEVRRALAW